MVSDALERTGVVEVLSSSADLARVKLRLRVNNESRWNHMITLILREERRSDWNVHICRQNILHENRLVYTWNFILQGDDLSSSVRDVCRVFDLICSNLDIFDDAEDREVKVPVKRKAKRKKAQGSRPERVVGPGDLNEIQLVGAEGRAIPEVAWNQFRSQGRRKGAHPIGGE